MGYIFIAFIIIIGYICSRIIIIPYLKLKYLKWKYGDRIATYFFPLKGFLHLFNSNTEKFGDAFHWIKSIMDNHAKSPSPDKKLSEIFVANVWDNIAYMILDPNLQKEVYANPFNY